MVTVLNFRETEHPLFRQGINTTSRSDGWSREVSPFFVGPIPLYDEMWSENMENAWQFSKVYDLPQFYNREQDTVLPGYYEWAMYGWRRKQAERYPMGRGAKPLFSIWAGERLSYVEARKKIYAPLYAEAVRQTDAFARMEKMYREQGELVLLDFDAYDHRRLGAGWYDVVNCPTKKMGHGFVLAMMLEGVLAEVLVQGPPKTAPVFVQGSLF